MAIAKQFTVWIENRPGALAQLCTELAKVAVNISAIQVVDARTLGPVRLLVSHPEAARRVFATLGLKHAEEAVLMVHVAERPGSLGKLTRKLAEANVNVEYVYGSIERGSKRAMLVFGVSDVERAARILK